MSKFTPKKIIALIIVAALVGAGAFAWYKKSHSNTTVPQETNITKNTSDSDSTIPGSHNNPASSDNTGNTDETTPMSVTISSAFYNKPSSVAVVKAIVEGVKSGTCTATFTKAGASSVTVSAPVNIVTSYYACDSLKVSSSKFSSGGTWSVKVSLTSGGQSVESQTASVAIAK